MSITLECRCSFSGDLTGVFTLGSSLFGGTDTLSAVWDFGGSFDFTGPYDDLSDLVESASWKRGRTDLVTHMLAGEGSVTILDENGIYNPANPSSPLAGLLGPLRPFYLKITDDDTGDSQVVFRGFTKSPPTHDATSIPPTSTFDLIDMFEILGDQDPTIASTRVTTTGAAIALILQQIGIGAAGMDLAAGDTIPDFSADGTVDALTLISNLLDAEQGSFFISGPGQAVYLDRYDRAKRTSLANLDGIAGSAETSGTDSGSLVNRQIVNDQSYEDDDSAHRYDWHDGSDITTPYLTSTIDESAAAKRLVVRNGQPRAWITDLTLSSVVDGNLPLILNAELGQRYTVPSGGIGVTGTEGDFYIERIEGQISAGVVTATWLLSQYVDAIDRVFVFGTSLLGPSSDPLG